MIRLPKHRYGDWHLPSGRVVRPGSIQYHVTTYAMAALVMAAAAVGLSVLSVAISVGVSLTVLLVQAVPVMAYVLPALAVFTVSLFLIGRALTNDSF